MYKNDARRQIAFSTVLVAVCLALLGCQKSTPDDAASPEPGPEAAPTSVQSATLGLPTFVQYAAPIALTSTTTFIGPSGGTVRAGHFTLTVPPGALAVPVPIVVSEINILLEQCSIEPTGLPFAKPATLTISYAGTTAALTPTASSGLAVWWLNPTLSRWVSLGGIVNKSTKTVSVPLNHLSYYALAK